MRIRDLGPPDVELMRLSLYRAVDWRGDGRYGPMAPLLERLPLLVFYEDWGRAGDAGYVAEADGEAVAACWYRLFTEDRHGEGFVDVHTPELAIAVAETHRGRGIGRTLMETLHDRGRRDGLARIGLSVEAGNPAKRLYESLGYVDFEPGDGRGRMLLAL